MVFLFSGSRRRDLAGGVEPIDVALILPGASDELCLLHLYLKGLFFVYLNAFNQRLYCQQKEDNGEEEAEQNRRHHYVEQHPYKASD